MKKLLIYIFVLLINITAFSQQPNVALVAISAQLDTPPVATLVPVLTNFNVADGAGTIVTFDSSSDATGLTTVGFAIPGKSITSITIDNGGLSGYFTVSPAFTFWDNKTIRLGEIGAATESQAMIRDFTLTYIVNNISEPTPSSEIFVSATAIGGGVGTEIDPYTFLEGIQNYAAGRRIWVKAGDYGDLFANGFAGKISGRNGTEIAPVWLEGYTSIPGDLDGVYVQDTFTYSTQAQAHVDLFNTAVYPNITIAVGDNASMGLYFRSADFWIIKNLQIQGAGYGIFVGTGTDEANCSSYLHFENVVSGFNQGVSNDNDYGAGLTTSKGSNNIRVVKSIFSDNQSQGIRLFGDSGLALSNDIYCGSGGSEFAFTTDYYISLYGTSNTIVKDNNAKRLIGVVGGNYSGHSFGAKGDAGNSFALFDNNYALNIGENLFAAYTNCHDIVFKNNTVINVNVTGMEGINARDGVYNSVWENNYIEGAGQGITTWHSAENYNVTPVAWAVKDCTFRNNIFNGGGSAVVSNNKNDPLDPLTPIPHDIENVDIINNTFYNFTGALFYFNITNDNSDLTWVNCNFKNNIVDTVTNELQSGAATDDYDQQYNLYYNSFTTPSGTGNVSTPNPNYVSAASGNFRPQATFIDIDVPTIDGVWYSKDGLERNATLTTVGAVLHTNETP